jgi:hypothetical protein
MSNLVIKKRTNNLFDVFFGGEGWEDWACFKKEKGRLLLVKGSPVPNSVYTEIFKQINNKG